MSWIDVVEALSRDANAVRDAVVRRILELPDNPTIKRLNGRCFSLRASELTVPGYVDEDGRQSPHVTSWSPLFHDFNAQHNLIAQQVQATDPLLIPAFLKRLVDGGVLALSATNKVRLHPVVRQQLKDLLNE